MIITLRGTKVDRRQITKIEWEFPPFLTVTYQMSKNSCHQLDLAPSEEGYRECCELLLVQGGAPMPEHVAAGVQIAEVFGANLSLADFTSALAQRLDWDRADRSADVIQAVLQAVYGNVGCRRNYSV